MFSGVFEGHALVCRAIPGERQKGPFLFVLLIMMIIMIMIESNLDRS